LREERSSSSVCTTFSSFQRSVDKDLPIFMTEGHWFVSFYNDYGDSQSLELTVSPSRELTEGCPRGCNGKGMCVLGRCKCEAGFGGDDCSDGKEGIQSY
jgi:hypothetical protein